MKSDNFGIYVHIPFCISKCNYCSFISFKCELQNIQKYIDFLCKEIIENAYLAKDKVVKNIYFGGGTPSCIKDCYINQILTCIKQNYVVDNNAEITIECNPCTIDTEKLKNYLEFGINRISFGVQSLNNNQLKILGRRHTREVAISAIKMAKDAGFKNISADVMIGIPKQTKQDILATAKELVDLGITHISTYMLMLEQGTPLYNMVQNNTLKVADDDECVFMYNCLYEFLKQNGYVRYEISNYALAGLECKNNINYWEMGEYLGFGVSAHSFMAVERFSNGNNLEDYYKRQGKHSEKLTGLEIIEETIMLGLRQAKGISLSNLKTLGYDLLEIKKKEIDELLKNNIITINGDSLSINEEHFGVCSAVILQLI